MSDLATWAIVLAGGLALPAVVVGLGLVWMRRRLAQVAAEDRATVRAAFATAGLPQRDEVVQLLLDGVGVTPSFASACHEPGLGWVDPDTSLPIQGVAFGWRPDPFFPGRRRAADEERSMDDLARELADLFPDERPRGTEEAEVAGSRQQGNLSPLDADGSRRPR